MKRIFNRAFAGFVCFGLLFSCSDGGQHTSTSTPSQSQTSTSNADAEDEDGSCGWRDGTYSATVDYYNPETEFSNTYTLDVVVEGCQVTQINFPNGGWLDDDHISPADIDADGEAEVEGEEGKTYTVHLESRND